MLNPNGDPSFQVGNQSVDPGILKQVGRAAFSGIEAVAGFISEHNFGHVSAGADASLGQVSPERRHKAGDPSAYDPVPDSWGSTRRT